MTDGQRRPEDRSSVIGHPDIVTRCSLNDGDRSPMMAQETRPTSLTHPMQHGHRPSASAQVPATLVPEAGWHFLHVFYQVDRGVLAGLSAEARIQGREQVIRALDRSRAGAPDQLQCFVVPGHKADFGLMMAGTDLKAVHGVQ